MTFMLHSITFSFHYFISKYNNCYPTVSHSCSFYSIHERPHPQTICARIHEHFPPRKITMFKCLMSRMSCTAEALMSFTFPCLSNSCCFVRYKSCQSREDPPPKSQLNSLFILLCVSALPVPISDWILPAGPSWGRSRRQ